MTEQPQTPQLEVTQVQYLEVHESALSKFVTEFYGRPWSMQQGEMLDQNTYRELEVSAEGPEYSNPVEQAEKDLADWLALERLEQPPEGTPNHVMYAWKLDMMRDNYISVDIVMWDLCRKGVIQPGNYLIKVWW